MQEINIVDMVRPCTKYAALVTSPTDIRRELEKAVRIARQGRPGPVWLKTVCACLANAALR